MWQRGYGYTGTTSKEVRTGSSRLSFALSLASIQTVSGFSPEPKSVVGCNRKNDLRTTTDVSIMRQLRTNGGASILRRAVDLWPYLFIVISVTGLTYLALTASH